MTTKLFPTKGHAVVFVNRHLRLMEEILDVLAEHQTPPQEAELVLAWLLGGSKGMRDAPVNDPQCAEALTVAWRLAVEDQEAHS